MLGRRKELNHIALIPPECLRHVLLRSVSSLPHNVYHYLDGCNYFQRVLLSGVQTGLHVDFVFNDSIIEPSFVESFSKGLNVFLICTDDSEELIEMNAAFSKICPVNCLFWVDKTHIQIFNMPNVISSESEFWDYMFRYSQPLMPYTEDPLCVPLCGGSVVFPYFKPANVTFNTITSALGNWEIGLIIGQDVEIKKILDSTKEAFVNSYGWDRQERSVSLVCQLYGLCQESLKYFQAGQLHFIDQIYPPLVIAAPYTNKDARDFLKKSVREHEDMPMVDKVFEMEETSNYCYDSPEKGNNNFFQQVYNALMFFHADRIDFLDFAASLHCSFRFSPYLRFPLLSKSVNTVLSFVGIKNNVKLSYSKNRQAYGNAIHKVGNLLATKLLSPKAIKMLKSIPTQVVAITDLPIEWIEIDDVPLGFSHDVCRIPETPVSGLLSHYGIARFASLYKIPKDILSKTLIVFGCTEDSFIQWQELVVNLANRLGAKTAVCKNLDDFESAVKQYKPFFLIIDSHGGTDLEIHQSYIFMGDNKVYPKDIVARRISAPLIFISACNTAPCYNEVNTVANAFLEVGALSITSSYLPLDLDESSILYIRILRQLNEAAHLGVHRNWLAFISHMLRTSFILASLSEPLLTSDHDTQIRASMVYSLSMIFENRPILYRRIMAGESVEGLRFDSSKIVPHYLMYTTIGRADLIEFEVSVNNRLDLYKKLLEH